MVRPMIGERMFAGWAALLLVGAVGVAHAQDAADGDAAGQAEVTLQADGEGVTAEAEAQAPEAQAPATTAIQAPRPAQPPATLEPPPPAPIMVAVLPQRRVPEEAAAAIGAAVAQALDEPAGRRDVHALGNPEIVARIAACEEDACYGAILAEAGAASGMFVTVTRRTRTYQLVFESRDPVSGALRAEAVTAEIPRDGAPADAMPGLLEQLTPLIPDPPPPDPTLLVTVNVDGAAVSIDGVAIGESPVAPVTVASGFHAVQVTRDGYAMVQRRTQVAPGDTARVDVTLTALSPDQVASAGGATSGGETNEVFETPITEEWWFWTLVAGGAVLVIGAAIIIGMVASQGSSTNNMLPTGLPLPRIEGGMF